MKDADATIHDLIHEGRSEKDAVTRFNDSATDGRAGLLKITFDAADAFFEEDDQIFVHPKDPYKVRGNTLVSHSLMNVYLKHAAM